MKLSSNNVYPRLGACVARPPTGALGAYLPLEAYHSGARPPLEAQWGSEAVDEVEAYALLEACVVAVLQMRLTGNAHHVMAIKFVIMKKLNQGHSPVVS